MFFIYLSILHVFLLLIACISFVVDRVTFAACVLHVLGVHLHTYLYHYMEFRVEVSK